MLRASVVANVPAADAKEHGVVECGPCKEEDVDKRLVVHPLVPLLEFGGVAGALPSRSGGDLGFVFLQASSGCWNLTEIGCGSSSHSRLSLM